MRSDVRVMNQYSLFNSAENACEQPRVKTALGHHQCEAKEDYYQMEKGIRNQIVFTRQKQRSRGGLTTAGLLKNNNSLRPTTSLTMHLRRVVIPRVTSQEQIRHNKDQQNLHMIIHNAEELSKRSASKESFKQPQLIKQKHEPNEFIQSLFSD